MARKAKELLKLRKETRLGQKRFGALFGYSDAQINRWENGGQGITDEAAILIADVLSVRFRRPITPFAVKPEFNHVQVGPLPERDQGHHLEAIERSYEIRAQKLIDDNHECPDDHSPEPIRPARRP